MRMRRAEKLVKGRKVKVRIIRSRAENYEGEKVVRRTFGRMVFVSRKKWNRGEKGRRIWYCDWREGNDLLSPSRGLHSRVLEQTRFHDLSPNCERGEGRNEPTSPLSFIPLLSSWTILLVSFLLSKSFQVSIILIATQCDLFNRQGNQNNRFFVSCHITR